MQHVEASIAGQRARWAADEATAERRADDVTKARAWGESSGGFGPFFVALADGLEGESECPPRDPKAIRSAQQNPQESDLEAA